MRSLPTDCITTLPLGAQFDGSGQSLTGFVMVPYGGVVFNGSRAKNFRGEIFAAYLNFHGSGAVITADTKGAANGDPGLIQ